MGVTYPQTSSRDNLRCEDAGTRISARIRDACSVGDDGELADYIPELASVDPDRFAVSACTLDGVVYTAGDADAEFTIQSMSKPFIYAPRPARPGYQECAGEGRRGAVR